MSVSINILEWARLHSVTFYGVEPAKVGNKGLGLTVVQLGSSPELTDCGRVSNNYGELELLSIPNELIISSDSVDQYAALNAPLHKLLLNFNPQTKRQKILLFLVLQLPVPQPTRLRESTEDAHPWSSYADFLPPKPPLPTLWSEAELVFLQGTSLEPAISSKLKALEKEFDVLQYATSNLSNSGYTLHDWILVDAWYRSRSLQLPDGDTVMIPILDLVNHSIQASARYHSTSDGRIALVSCPDTCAIAVGDEVTISYGREKSAAEMLFSYGFVDDDSSYDKIVLSLSPFVDDPLAAAKCAVFKEPLVVTVETTGHDDASVLWHSPFAFFSALNEEDGLKFHVLESDLSTMPCLRVMWQDNDVTNAVDKFECHIRCHSASNLLRLRAITIVLQRISSQLEGLETPLLADANAGDIRVECVSAAKHLRLRESRLLKRIMVSLKEEAQHLMQQEDVLLHLAHDN